MKKVTNAVFLTFALAIIAAACVKSLPDINFTLPIPDQQFTVVPIPDTATVTINTPSIKINLDSAIKANSVGAYSANSATLSSGVLSTDSLHNFRAFKSIDIYVTSTGLGDQLIGSNDDIATASTVSLKTTGTNVLSYLKKEAFNLKIKASMRHPQQDTMSVKAAFKFYVNLKGS